VTAFCFLIRFLVKDGLAYLPCRVWFRSCVPDVLCVGRWIDRPVRDGFFSRQHAAQKAAHTCTRVLTRIGVVQGLTLLESCAFENFSEGDLGAADRLTGPWR
jgi:hypothetical protein